MANDALFVKVCKKKKDCLKTAHAIALAFAILHV